MKKIIKAKEVSKEKDYYHVRVRRPNQFIKIRIPKYAAIIANSISKNAKIKMGLTKAGNWKIQSVLITIKNHSEDDALRLTNKIIIKIEG